jgi:hypothetical protein
MVLRVEDIPAEVVNETRDPGHNAPSILAMNQKNNGFFSLCHRKAMLPNRVVSSGVADRERSSLYGKQAAQKDHPARPQPKEAPEA